MQDVVASRLAKVDLREAMLMERLAHGPEGLSPELLTAARDASKGLPQPVFEQISALIAEGFHAARVDQMRYPGATMVAFAAALACRRFSKVPADQLHELTWRWDKATDSKLGTSVLKLNLRAVAEKFLVPA